MKGFFLTILCSLALVTLGVAQSQDLPQCALACLGKLQESGICSPGDAECICHDPTFTAQAHACISSSCTIKEALVTQNITATTCGEPIRDQRGRYKAAVVVYVIAGVAIIMRMTARFWSPGVEWRSDDLATLIFFFLTSAILALALEIVHLGLGTDIWTIPPNHITTILMVFWVDEICYFTGIALLKICFLLFYLRIFQERRFRLITWFLIAFNALVAIAFIITLCASCAPTSYAWTRWDGEHEGKCGGNSTATTLANGGINIFLDFVTLGLPISQIWGLHMSTKKKIAVISMLSVGLLVTIISIIRLDSLLKLETSTNITWDYFDAALWSTIELNVGTICLCMPALRQLLVRLFPTLGSTVSASVSAGGGPPAAGSKRNKSSQNAADGSGAQNDDLESLHIWQKRQYEVDYELRAMESQDSVNQLVEVRDANNRV